MKKIEKQIPEKTGEQESNYHNCESCFTVL